MIARTGRLNWKKETRKNNLKKPNGSGPMLGWNWTGMTWASLRLLLLTYLQGSLSKKEIVEDHAAFDTLLNHSANGSLLGKAIHYLASDGHAETGGKTWLPTPPLDTDRDDSWQPLDEQNEDEFEILHKYSGTLPPQATSPTIEEEQRVVDVPLSSFKNTPVFTSHPPSVPPFTSRIQLEADEEVMMFPSYEEDTNEIVPVEQRLMNNLLRNYERSVRPVKNASDTVMVRMGLTLTQIFDMDEKNQILVTNVWLDQEWDDMFLRWDPVEYDNLTVLRLPCHKIWLPDIVLYNNAAEYTDGLMPANAMITSGGNVFWPVPTKLQSTCKVDVTYFPFDEQLCRLKFGSWTYDGFQVDMFNRTVEVDLSNYVPNGEWELISIEIKRNVVYYRCCPEPFPDVTFIVHIQRRILYYLYNVIFPCIMMSALTLLVFCLPPDSGEKITMGITVLLAFSVFMLTVAEDLPETSEFIPLLSIYLTIVMGMTSMSIIMTVFVLNLHHRGPGNNKPVPPWLRSLCLRKKMSKSLCFKKKPKYKEGYYTDGQTHYITNVPLKLTIENLAQELKEELDNCTSDFTSDTPSTNTGNYDTHYVDTAPPPAVPDTSRRQQYYVRNTCTKTNEDILHALRKIIERYENDDSDEHIIFEWRQVALAVDRVLFWIFLVGTLSSTILILIVAPITKWL